MVAGTTQRPIELRMREDLRVVQQVQRGELTYVVGDMLALQYYNLNEQEFVLLELFDGRRSPQDIKEHFEARFAPHQIRLTEIQAYLMDFHKKSLVSNGASDQGRHLHRRGQTQAVKKRLASLKSILALRFRGLNPHRFFQVLTPWTSWFFSPWMIAINVAFMMFALLWLGSHFDEFSRKLPSLQNFFSMGNLVTLAGVMVVMKIVHELGHGIVFTKYGGRCHELGLMFLVFMPTLYVNTSDSWRIPNKWRRAWIAAAGVYVELCMAAMATFAWWYSKPGPQEYIFLNVMFLGSLSAVLFNGNPLLKFDGYYVLSDILEIPNLQQRSRKLIRNSFLSYGFGVEEGDESLLPRRTQLWLAVYAITAFAYRFFIVYFIAFTVVRLSRPFGLENIAKMFSFFLMSLLVLAPIMAVATYFVVPGRRERAKPGRTWLTALLVGGIVLVFFAVPFPDTILCEFTVQPQNAQTIYVTHDARLHKIHVQPREWVEAGQTIATLRNLDVELEVAELEGRLGELESERRVTRLTRFDSHRNSDRLRLLEKEAITAQKRLEELRKVAAGLEVIAPRSGTVIPLWQNLVPKLDPDALEEWDGWTLSDENLNAQYKRGQPICRIGDLTETEARILIDQGDVQHVQLNQKVTLLLDSQTSQSYDSTIESIAEADAEEIDSHLTRQFGGTIETKQNRAAQVQAIQDPNKARPAYATYEARAKLPAQSVGYEDGLRGLARIRIEDRTLAGRLIRFLNQTFRFDL